jgi:hypothetical protein
MMTPAQQELFDLAILRVLDRNRTRYGLTPDSVRILITEFGFHNAELDLVKDRIEYLTDKKLLEEVMKGVNKNNRCWRITDAGIEHLDKRG